MSRHRTPNRRDFLKLAPLLPLGLAAAPLARIGRPSPLTAGGKTNVLIIVFDAFSAYHMSMYGYARETTPNLSSLADRAIVYHNHYAGSDFTTPGTASLLTGALPWTHRAFGLGSPVAKEISERSLFRAFGSHHRVVYSHNPWVYTLCDQFAQDLDEYVPLNRLLLAGHDGYDRLFSRDADTAGAAWERTMDRGAGDEVYSLILSWFHSAYTDHQLRPWSPVFPLGVPKVGGRGHFLLEDAIDWIRSEVQKLPQPYLGYFHLLPPHNPYAPPVDFHGSFGADQFRPTAKPMDPLATGDSEQVLLTLRQQYDEFILYVDREFARLFAALGASGVLEDTWVVLTSDHGELLERGHRGHIGPLLYEPVVRVPLLIFEPGRRSRLDVHTPTSAVDLLPTLLHVTGQDPALWAEGSVLPPFGAADAERPVFAQYVVDKDGRKRITHATTVIMKSGYKLMYLFGYPELGGAGERLELYNLQQDPEELIDLSSTHGAVARELLGELKARLRRADEPYA